MTNLLVYWQDDWFVGYRFGDLAMTVPERRFLLVGGNRVAYVDDRLTPKDNPWLRYFSRDPGFTYYPIIRYQGLLVAPICIKVDGTFPREVFITEISGRLWTTSATTDSGLAIVLPQFVRIDELEKEEGRIPGPSGNWSLPDP